MKKGYDFSMIRKRELSIGMILSWVSLTPLAILVAKLTSGAISDGCYNHDEFLGKMAGSSILAISISIIAMFSPGWLRKTIECIMIVALGLYSVLVYETTITTVPSLFTNFSIEHLCWFSFGVVIIIINVCVVALFSKDFKNKLSDTRTSAFVAKTRNEAGCR